MLNRKRPEEFLKFSPDVFLYFYSLPAGSLVYLVLKMVLFKTI